MLQIVLPLKQRFFFSCVCFQLSVILFPAEHTHIHICTHVQKHAEKTESDSVLWPGADGGPCDACGRPFPVAACVLHNGNLWGTLFVFIFRQVIKSRVLCWKIQIRALPHDATLTALTAITTLLKTKTHWKEQICWFTLQTFRQVQFTW